MSTRMPTVLVNWEAAWQKAKKVSRLPILRGPRQWHGNERCVLELGRPVQISERDIRRQAEKEEGAEMFERESDRPIVVRKQSNACGAKGPAPMRRDSGQHSPDTEPEIKGMGTKLDFIAFRSERG